MEKTTDEKKDKVLSKRLSIILGMALQDEKLVKDMEKANAVTSEQDPDWALNNLVSRLMEGMGRK